MKNNKLKPYVHKIKGAKNYAFYGRTTRRRTTRLTPFLPISKKDCQHLKKNMKQSVEYYLLIKEEEDEERNNFSGSNVPAFLDTL